MKVPIARQIMKTNLVTLRPDMDIYAAIKALLRHRVSGAPVIDEKKNLVGVLSEKDCLKIFAHGAYNNLPGGIVSDYMSKTTQSISLSAGLFEIADIFLKFPFRRLPVVEEGRLVGQVSRRDVLEGSRRVWETLHGEPAWTDSTFIPEQVRAALETRRRPSQIDA